MARGVNKVILLGSVGKDPQVKYLPSGSAVVNLSLATNESWKDKNTGQVQDRTEWHRLVIFGRLAEIAAQYLKKGSQIYVEGKLQTRKWQDKNGQDRYTTEINVNEMQMIGSSNGQATQANTGAGYNQNVPQQQQSYQANMNQADFDSDIPF